MEICILVCHHKKFNLIKNEVFKPIQVGKSISDVDLGICGDDTGEHISHLNKYYSELTATYWAWKNLDSRFIGICHYRRYFFNQNIVDDKFKRQSFLFRFKWLLNQLPGVKIPGFFASKFSVNQEASRFILEEVASWFIESVGKEKNVIYCLKPVKFLARSNRDLFAQIGMRYLDQLVKISAQVNPHFSSYILRCLNADYLYYANMVIMSRELYNEYCDLMFTILEQHFCINENDLISYSRVAGYMGEIVTSAFIMMKEKENVKLIYMNELFVV